MRRSMFTDFCHKVPILTADEDHFTALVKSLCDSGAFWSYFKILKSPPDGHCIIHSILRCLLAKYGELSRNTMSLLHTLMNECLSNINSYMPYFDGDSNLFLYLMNEYMIRKVYNTSFGDIVPFIMSNALNEIIVIIETNSNGPRVMVIKPKNSYHPVSYCYLDRCLCLIKHTDHYDACVPLHDLDPYDTSFYCQNSASTWGCCEDL